MKNTKQIHLRREEMQLICWALEYFANAPHRDARHKAFAHHIYNRIYDKCDKLTALQNSRYNEEEVGNGLQNR